MRHLSRLLISGLVALSLTVAAPPAQADDADSWTATITDVMNLVFCLVGTQPCTGLQPGADLVDTQPSAAVAVYCLKGTMDNIESLDVINGTPASGVLEYLEGQSVSFGFSFSSFTSIAIVADDDWGQAGGTEITTGPVTLAFGGDDTGYLQEVVAPAFAGVTMTLHLGNPNEWSGMGEFSIGNVVSPAGDAYWGLEGGSYEYMPYGSIQLCVSEACAGQEVWDALPLWPMPTSGLILRRYSDLPGAGMTDFAHSNAGTLSLIRDPESCP